MKQILLFPILQMRKPRREHLGGQSPGSLAPEFVSLPHCHYNTIRINLGSQLVDVPGQMFTAFAGSCFFSSRNSILFTGSTTAFITLRADNIQACTDTNLLFHVCRLQLSGCFSVGVHTFGFPQITIKLKQIKWHTKINWFNIKFMNQEDKMRFAFSPSQHNKKRQTTLGTDFSNLKKSKYHMLSIFSVFIHQIPCLHHK